MDRCSPTPVARRPSPNHPADPTTRGLSRSKASGKIHLPDDITAGHTRVELGGILARQETWMPAGQRATRRGESDLAWVGAEFEEAEELGEVEGLGEVEVEAGVV